MSSGPRGPAWTGTLGLHNHGVLPSFAPFKNYSAPVTLHNGRSFTVGYDMFSLCFDVALDGKTPTQVIHPRRSWWRRHYDITMAAPHPVFVSTGWWSWKITFGGESRTLCFHHNGRHRRFEIGEMVFAHFDYKSHLYFRCPDPFIPTAAVVGHILFNGSSWNN
jgi:hypothetical protein